MLQVEKFERIMEMWKRDNVYGFAVEYALVHNSRNQFLFTSMQSLVFAFSDYFPVKSPRDSLFFCVQLTFKYITNLNYN